MHVRDWMTAPAITVTPDRAAFSALALMNLHGIRRLPVVEDGRLVGIVTRTTLAGVAGQGNPGRRGSGKLVIEVMTKDPVSVAPEDTVETAARLMLRRKFSGLPVVDGGYVVGVVTESDVFRAICRMFGVDGRGARLEVDLADDRALADFITTRLEDFEILNLVTVPNPREGGWKVVMRVRGRNRAKARIGEERT